MQIFLRVRSEYAEDDTSRYRNTITKHTLIPSLKHQAHKEFTIILTQREDDKHYAARAKAFGAVGAKNLLVYDDPITTPHIMVDVGDDDFLCPTFLQDVQRASRTVQNTQLTFPHGYIFHEKKLKNWRNHPDFVQVNMIVEPGASVAASKECDLYPSWIYCRHRMNSIQIPHQEIQGLEIQGLTWKGWSQTVVSTYCSIALKTGTAVGCVPGPQRSNSMVFGEGQRKKRRQMKF